MALPDILQGLRIPVIGAPLFIISNPALVIAQCKAGIVGSFPALNARPQSQLDEWLHEITEALAALGRNAVPVYALYAPGEAAPMLLPEVLTPALVLEALSKLPSAKPAATASTQR